MAVQSKLSAAPKKCQAWEMSQRRGPSGWKAVTAAALQLFTVMVLCLEKERKILLLMTGENLSSAWGDRWGWGGLGCTRVE